MNINLDTQITDNQRTTTQKLNAAKAAACATAGAGIITAGIIAGNKTDAFVKAKDAIQNSGAKEAFKNITSKAGKVAADTLDRAKNICTSVKGKLPKLGLADKAKKVFAPVRELAGRVTGNIVKFASTVADNIEAKFNSIKFNPDVFKNIKFKK